MERDRGAAMKPAKLAGRYQKLRNKVMNVRRNKYCLLALLGGDWLYAIVLRLILYLH